MDNLKEASNEMLEFLKVLKHSEGVFYQDSYIYQENSVMDYVYIIQDGLVGFEKINSSGKILEVELRGKGKFIGVECLLGSSAKSSANVKACSKVVVVQAIKIEEIKNTYKDNIDFYKCYSKLLTHYSLNLIDKISDFALHSKKGALCSVLVRLANTFGIDTTDGKIINIHVTNDQLAELAGISTKESTHRILKSLKDDDIIEFKNNLYIIKDIDYLEQSISIQERRNSNPKMNML
ncbi:Crp/Fnr family transcriptional regulator [Bacillus cereus]|nr:Crp/Fnr family transcriptional regulator [Bacillus cereus]